MTLEDAKSIGAIISNADGGCSHCVDVLREMCEETWPQFTWTMPKNSYQDPVIVEEKSIG